MTDCRWTTEGRMTARHLRDCNTSGCAGCEPCTEDHCRCGRHLRDSERLTCARCVGRTRKDLKRIGELCQLAPVAATEGGIGSAVMILAGPVPEHSTHTARHRWAVGGALCRCAPGQCPDDQPMPSGPPCEDATNGCAHHTCKRRTYRPTCPGLADWLEYAAGDDELHPLWVLGTWDMLVAEHLEHDRRDRVTVAGAVAYLAMQLTYLAQDEGFAFDELATQVRDCREHVEQIMGVAAYTQRGAPCPTCRRDLELHHDPAIADGSGDRWRCGSKTCEQRELTLDQYAERVYRDYLDKATALTAAQILAQYRVPESKVRSWAQPTRVSRDGAMSVEPPKLKCVGRDSDGRKLYPVDVVLQLRGTA